MTSVGLGCVGLGSGAGRRVADDVRLVQAAIDVGVTMFDTADAYGSGASERVLGRALRARRDEVVVATKGGFLFRRRTPAEQWARRWLKPVVERVRSTGAGGALVPAPGAGRYEQQDFSPRYLRDAVQASLRRLGTDRIDVYQLHGPREVLPELLTQLDDLVAVGDVGRFGVGADSVASADLWVEVDGVSVVQVPFGVLDPAAAATTIPRALERDREVWARGVLGGGLLGLAGRDPAAIADDPQRPRIERLRQIAADSGLDVFRLALGYVQANPCISAVLFGSTSLDHLRRNVDALAEPPLDEQVVKALDAVAKAGTQ